MEQLAQAQTRPTNWLEHRRDYILFQQYQLAKGTSARTYVLRKIWAERGVQGLTVIAEWLGKSPDGLAADGGFTAKFNRAAWGSKASRRGHLPTARPDNTSRYGEGAHAPGIPLEENLHQRQQPGPRDPAMVETVKQAIERLGQTETKMKITPQAIANVAHIPLPASLQKTPTKSCKSPIVTITLIPDSDGKYEQSAVPEPIPAPGRTAIAGPPEPLTNGYKLSAPSKMPSALEFLDHLKEAQCNG